MEQPNEGVNGVAKPEGQSPSGEEQGPHDDYHDYSRTVGGMEVASKFLQTTIEKGLTNHEVEERRKEFGPNQILEQRNWTLYFLRCFFGYTPFMLSVGT
jgi:magnesium-transporting ATPase (P-type)